jgi:hypothetical protein
MNTLLFILINLAILIIPSIILVGLLLIGNKVLSDTLDSKNVNWFKPLVSKEDNFFSRANINTIENFKCEDFIAIKTNFDNILPINPKNKVIKNKKIIKQSKTKIRLKIKKVSDIKKKIKRVSKRNKI